jgi:hypothetical protein
MRLLRKLLERIDANLEGNVERHLRLAGIPEPRRSMSPSQVIDQHLLPAQRLERIGTFPCCDCCPPGCTEAHRDPCDRHQGGGVA